MTTYEHKTMRYRTDHRKVKRMLKEGWEIVSHHPGVLMSAPTTVLRRPVEAKPKKRGWLAGLVEREPHPNSIAARLERRRTVKNNI